MLHRAKRVGIGLILDFDQMKVLDIVPKGPCEGKLQKGDFLTRIDGVKVDANNIFQYSIGVESSIAILSYTRGVILQIEHQCLFLSGLLFAGNVSDFVEVCRKFANDTPTKETVQEQISRGFKRRSEKEIRKVFEKFAQGDRQRPESLHIPKSQLLRAFQEFDISLKDTTEEDVARINELFEELDTDCNGKLDYNEFMSAVQKNQSILENWAKSLPLHQLLADAIPRYEGENALDIVRDLKPDDIDLIVGGFANGLKEMLIDYVEQLKRTMLKIEKNHPAQSREQKFIADVPKMRCGSIDDFHKGLTARIGNAHVHFESAMEIEHCQRLGALWEFETKNYHIKTTPKWEWEIVQGQRACPIEETCEPMVRTRRIPNINELLSLDVAIEANLIEAEVVAIVLYTGPMYIIYNGILRQYPEDFYQTLMKANNTYPTTLFVLSSAIQKLSRTTRIQSGMLLYRGLSSDVDLPELFHKQDSRGCTGFTEWGFMSTSKKKEVALEYSKMGNEAVTGLHPRLLVISVGSVDRGAFIGDFSQYRDEEEYLFVPCSFVEKTGTPCKEVTDSGLVEIIPVKVNANLKAKTVDELLAQKRDMHIAAFSYHLELLEQRLKRIATKRDAISRLKRDKSAAVEDSDETYTVDGFINRIVDQCKEVLSRHKAVNNKDFNNDDLFRSLVFEKLHVQTMAVSKLREWLENESCFIRYRWNAPLRTVHRRWTLFLDDRRNSDKATSKSKIRDSVRRCRALGLIGKCVDEKNELEETRIMCAAAEGKSGRFLRLLVDAKASVSQSRPDGVTPMWLAAESGHEHCVQALAELNADVSKPSNSKATPIYIAARNGRTECIKVLAELNADVNISDNNGSYPVHQAALYGHYDSLKELVRLKADINIINSNGLSPWDIAMQSGHDHCAHLVATELAGKGSVQISPKGGAYQKSLIISTGDISDADGFFALAQYAKTGADVLFIMNYPAYIGVDKVDESYAETNPGLGYMYSAHEVLERDKSTAPQSYADFLSSYGENLSPNQLVKSAMTDLAFALANHVWDEVEDHGSLMFGIGGINSVNPFSVAAIKNEILVYSHLVTPSKTKLKTDQGSIYGSDGQICKLNYSHYRDVFMDFNGSLAFWNGFLANTLIADEVVSKIRGVFVMGGVQAEREPLTMPPIPNVLNRFSSATMNQLYHPQNAANFFAFLAQFKIPTWTVSNNVVHDLTTWITLQDGSCEKSMVGIDLFLSSNGLGGKFLRQLAEAHYNSLYNPQRKPFDLYCAFALTTYMQSFKRGSQSPLFSLNVDQKNGAKKHFESELPKTLFYSNVYGITFISSLPTWDSTLAVFSRVIITEIGPQDSDDEKNKKRLFKKELEIMKTLYYLGSLQVLDLSFDLDPDTKKLDFAKP